MFSSKVIEFPRIFRELTDQLLKAEVTYLPSGEAYRSYTYKSPKGQGYLKATYDPIGKWTILAQFSIYGFGPETARHHVQEVLFGNEFWPLEFGIYEGDGFISGQVVVDEDDLQGIITRFAKQ